MVFYVLKNIRDYLGRRKKEALRKYKFIQMEILALGTPIPRLFV